MKREVLCCKKISLFVIGEPRPKKNIFHVVSSPFEFHFIIPSQFLLGKLGNYYSEVTNPCLDNLLIFLWENETAATIVLKSLYS